MKNSKKILCILLAILCISANNMNVFAKSYEIPFSDLHQQIDYEADGSYYVTEIKIINENFRSSKTGQKSVSYYTASGNLAWKLTVTGTYTYNGSSASCTSASSSISNIRGGWSIVSKSAYPSGSVAIGTATMHQNGGTNVTRSAQLKCSGNGSLS